MIIIAESSDFSTYRSSALHHTNERSPSLLCSTCGM